MIKKCYTINMLHTLTVQFISNFHKTFSKDNTVLEPLSSVKNVFVVQ